ncbi:MAG: xanthine dehydrogenase family protein molybdopterin-binding subunit [Defluviicoccus sp.]|nr:xanthine dehydrogenase family protein molybdopterin-binding subunit [Defluviicoccus sp.]
MTPIGESVTRLEDGPLLTGSGRFADDYNFPGQLHMRVVRAPSAHGRIAAIHTDEALAMPGVVAVWTGADVADIPPIDFRLSRVAGLEPYRQPVLAQGIVRYVGEPVALVFAEERYIAEDAAEAVLVEVDGEAPYLDCTAAPPRFLPGLDCEAALVEKYYGDLDAAFAAADHVLALEFAVGRHSGVPIETRGALGLYNAERSRIELYGAAKVPHYNRNAIAAMLGLGRTELELFEGHVGGGFGMRGELYPEDVLVCIAATRLGRPVKWIEDRRENLLALNHSRDQVHRIRAAIDESGFVLGLDDEIFSDQGAYVRSHGVTVVDLATAMLPGPYLIPAYRARAHVRLTNKTPAGTYRAPGRYESTFARERLLDAVADRVGIDRIEVRRRNLIPADRMPYSRYFQAMETPVLLDSGLYENLLDRLLERVGYPTLQAEIARRREAGACVGLGLGYFVEKSGLGPFDDVRVEIAADGGIEVITGVASVGQGVETAVAQICAEALGTDYRSISVTHGQTDRIERGMGAFASRVTVMTGMATHLAATRLKDALRPVAARLLQSGEDGIAFADGMVSAGGDGPSSPLGAVAAALAEEQGNARATAEATFEVEHMTYPYGIHLVQLAIDRETCGIEIERFAVAFDIGRAVNPMLVEGQIHGGAAQGLGGALYEEFLYDDSGQPLSASFVDYLIPGSEEIPRIESLVREDAPSGTNPLGLKGAGEAGINGAGAAVAAAIDDAIGRPGAIARLPVTPARLHALLNEEA